MTKISMAQAAKMFAVSRPTLLKHLQQGKITGERVTVDKNTVWKIDVAELARVYPRRDEVAGQEHAAFTKSDMGAAPDLQAEIRVLQAQLDAAERLLDERGRHIEDLRRLLTGPQDPVVRRGWWPWR
jgi:hypothetical protein